ncbi:TPA: hypothetical protein ACQVKO_004817, partial [Serratia marcescens]
MAKWSEICETWINALLQARWSVFRHGNRDRQTIAPLFPYSQNNLNKIYFNEIKKQPIMTGRVLIKIKKQA